MSPQSDMEEFQRAWGEFVDTIRTDRTFHVILLTVWLVCVANAILWWIL